MSEKILLVDDEPNIIASLKRSLRKEKFDIFSANSALEALSLLEKTNIDVVISDEQMPGMLGSEFLALVRKKYPETVRIILTGQASLQAAIRAINQGEIYRFLMKPCNDVDLVVTIRQALQQKRMLLKMNQLYNAYKQKSHQLDKLEQEHPGITNICKASNGAIVIEDIAESYEDLLNEMN
jgi:two-component system, probable response regulator PhcQ